MTKRDTGVPAQNSRRWTIRRKAAVLEALSNGVLTFEQAGERYALSVEELRSWQRDFDRHGLYGLRALRVYREEEEAG